MNLEDLDSKDQGREEVKVPIKINHRQWITPDIRELVIANLQKLKESSHDRSTQTSAIIFSPDRMGKSEAWNGFTFGIDPNNDKYHTRENNTKYAYIEHAERHAIYQAARQGCALEGAVMVCSWFPCADCARAIVMSGIKEVYFLDGNLENTKINFNFEASKEILTAGRVIFELL